MQDIIYKHGSGLRLLTALFASWTLLTGCSSQSTYQYDLIPIPLTFKESAQKQISDTASYEGILYVTDREPASTPDDGRPYTDEQASALRVGLAKVDYSGDPISEEEEEARLKRVEPGETSGYPLSLTETTELGYLEHALPYSFLTSREDLGHSPPVDDKFVALINDRLKQSRSKDIYIYVNGRGLVFDNPVIVAAQLWYFMNNDGVFLPFAWTSIPKTFAYAKDTQMAEVSARNLRLLLEFLVERTSAERIHLIAFSAGSRVVMGALHQLALQGSAHSGTADQYRIGQVLLLGSDYDEQRWAAVVADGLLEVLEELTVYVSPFDDMLSLSEMLLGGRRLGKLGSGPVPEVVREWLLSNERLHFIDVTGAAGAAAGAGHSYLQTSPWIGSDMLATLVYGLSPGERGLQREADAVGWSFPADYDQRLKTIINRQDPL